MNGTPLQTTNKNFLPNHINNLKTTFILNILPIFPPIKFEAEKTIYMYIIEKYSSTQ